ncbi:hypothetical protein OC834_000837 [Tilletia horrida]|nr:hypothetical protein OC834_000837 [Tilletia horrida]
MPVCTLLLLSLRDGHAGIDGALDTLRRADGITIVTAAHVHRPIIRASSLDARTLNDTPWHLLLLVQGAAEGGRVLRALSQQQQQRQQEERVAASYMVTLGVPSKLVSRYAAYSDELARRPPPALSSSLDTLPQSRRSGQDGRPQDSQNLEVSDELLRFADELERRKEFASRPVVMLNLLQFEPGMHESYKQYGKGFMEIGARHGGDAKLVGLVVAPPADAPLDSRGDRARNAESWWSEAAYAQYPSIRHFIDMAADAAYQDINQRFRLPALRDTTIICTTELDRERYTGTNSKAHL